MPLLSVNSADRAPLLFFAPPVEVGELVTIGVLDLWTETEVEPLRIVSHPFVLTDRQRNRRKRMKRLILFGTAESIEGTITFRCDGLREETYEVKEVYDAQQRILILQECSMAMTGTVPEIELNLRAKKIVPLDMRLELVMLD